MECPGIRNDLRLLGLKELIAGKICENPAFANENDAICEIECLIEIVGHQQNGGLHAVQQIAQHVLHFCPSERIERAEGLVHEQDFRFGSQRTSQSDALPLPARELMGKALRKRHWLEADKLQQFVAASDSFVTVPSFRFKNDADVAFCIEMRKKTGLLNDVTHFSAQLNEAEIVDGSASYIDLAARRLDHPVCRAEERGFPGAATAENRGDSAFLERQRDVVEQQSATLQGNRNISEFERSAHRTDIHSRVPWNWQDAVAMRVASRSASTKLEPFAV